MSYDFNNDIIVKNTNIVSSHDYNQTDTEVQSFFEEPLMQSNIEDRSSGSRPTSRDETNSGTSTCSAASSILYETFSRKVKPLQDALGGKYGAVSLLLAQVFYHNWTMDKLIRFFHPRYHYSGQRGLFKVLNSPDVSLYFQALFTKLSQSNYIVTDPGFNEKILFPEGEQKFEDREVISMRLSRSLHLKEGDGDAIVSSDAVRDVFLYAYLQPKLTEVRKNKNILWFKWLALGLIDIEPRWYLCKLEPAVEFDGYYFTAQRIIEIETG
eukprot:snap_masked-scaffold_36-processed-gene-2.80-mRNA-1 protein AED:1.00 eAED:1.00 QI:0/-1/0/0/-1/1/1/0/267